VSSRARPHATADPLTLRCPTHRSADIRFLGPVGDRRGSAGRIHSRAAFGEGGSHGGTATPVTHGRSCGRSFFRSLHTSTDFHGRPGGPNRARQKIGASPVAREETTACR